MADSKQINPLQNLFADIKKILEYIEIKDKEQADKYETEDSQFKAGRWMNAMVQSDSYITYKDYWTYSMFQNIKNNVRYNDYTKYIENPYSVPLVYQESLREQGRNAFLASYEEENEYYRMLNGLPPLGTNEKDYIYSINWIMAIIVGGFFLYALFFSGMMLARRQIEFLFLFVISPIVFATSIGNKERRNAVVQQLVSLMLQGAVIMLIISLTAIVMGQINETTFFSNAFKDIVIKSIMYIGCGSFLLTGSQVVNRFIGGNVSANSGREQLMAMMGFGQAMGGIATTGGLAAAGAGLMGAGAIVKGTSKVGGVGNSALGKVGQAVSNFGSKIGGDGSSYGGIGSNLKMVGDYMQASSNLRRNNVDSKGQAHSQSRLSRFGSGMMNAGSNAMASAMQSIAPTRTMYRRRYRGRDE